jgi:hypothetical protein
MTLKKGIENVLILRGDGSLGAFGCGVFKAIAQSQVKIETYSDLKLRKHSISQGKNAFLIYMGMHILL